MCKMLVKCIDQGKLLTGISRVSNKQTQNMYKGLEIVKPNGT